ncbi:MAG: hypothetical protein KatS3mg082_3458 [Nitrospiraceae bacterium]|nr:MAG: hypothetical protein KatS3mg082_3458 [Nitrospiraceae bacterium]
MRRTHCALLFLMLASAGQAKASLGESKLLELPGIWQPRGDTQVRALDRFDLGLGVQYRLVYNASNIPGPAGTTFGRTETYDFFRQRLRLNLAIAPHEVAAGGFVQAEFRGGFGGSSPNVSDPRGQEPTRNPFNNLQARGIRYGFLHARPFTGHTLLAGVLPLSDEFGDTLFSADWDFNVGGVALLGAYGTASYRLAYLRLIEGVGASDSRQLGKDGDFFLADLVCRFAHPRDAIDELRIGVHTYFLSIAKGLPLGATDDGWYGISARARRKATELRAFAVANVGRLGIGVLDEEGKVVSGFDCGDAHAGYAFKLEVRQTVGPFDAALQSLYSSGDPEQTIRDRFVTPQGLLRTEGYWAYTHLFTANPPSDVNDLAIELGNGGAGLLTLQARAATRLHPGLGMEVAGGWFRAARTRNGSRDIGGEIAAMFSFDVATGLVLDVGVAGALLGDFFAPRADDLFEAFTRLQFQY